MLFCGLVSSKNDWRATERAGLDDFLTVLEAQRTLRDGEDRLATAETRVAVSAIAVYKSVGGGL